MKRPSLVLAGAVVLCLPLVPSFLAGTIAPLSALERFLLALVVCWIAATVELASGNRPVT